MSDQRPLTELVTPNQARVTLKVALKITAIWGLTDEQTRTLLGSPSPDTLQAWKEGGGPPLGEETILRIGHIVSIYRSLDTLLPLASAAHSWIKRPNDNPLYKGRRPLDVMLESLDGLQLTVRHLLAEIYS